MKFIYKKAFTLIEIIVSITILSIIMISVMMIFLNATSLSAKSDINRVMQENVKNLIETISEDIRENWITWVSKNSIDPCNFNFEWTNNYKIWTKLCTNANNVYFLAKEVANTYIRIDDMSLCNKISDNCFILKNWDKLTNSSVAIKDLKFYITNDYNPKVTLSLVLQASSKKGVKSNLIEENKIILQTTISDRSILKKYN